MPLKPFVSDVKVVYQLEQLIKPGIEEEEIKLEDINPNLIMVLIQICLYGYHHPPPPPYQS